MSDVFRLVEPRVPAPLDPDFRPAVLANRNFQKEIDESGGGVPLVMCLERAEGAISRFETRVFPDGHPRAEANLMYAERIFKFLLWQWGGWKAWIGGPRAVGEYIREAYAPDGARAFDYHFMGEDVFDRPFTVVPCDASEAPAAREQGLSYSRLIDGLNKNQVALDRKILAELAVSDPAGFAAVTQLAKGA